jgi:ABC-type nitrate/sulfonate/bicarbonate transport system ATPase subunit
MAAPVAPQDAPPAVLVRLEQVEHLYHGRIRILGPLDLEIREGELLSLVGP